MSKNYRLEEEQTTQPHSNYQPAQGGAAIKADPSEGQFPDHSTDAPLPPDGQTVPNRVTAEKHADPWLPHRGQGYGVYHGVTPTEEITAPKDYWDYQRQAAKTDVFVEPEKHELDPVPVVIVSPSSGGRQITTARGYTFTSSDAVLQLLGRDERRRWVRIKNNAILGVDLTGSVRIGDENGTSGVSGYLLTPGEYVELVVQDTMYFCNDAASSAGEATTISIMVTYGLDLD